MKVREYIVMAECIERGVDLGYHRAHKHDDNPSEDTIKEAIALAVQNEICEYFIFDELGDE